MTKKPKLKILMASAEVAPFAKVGGLADVVGSLPPALKKIGCDARVIMPKYGSIDEKKYELKKIHEDIKVPSQGKKASVDLWEGNLPGTKVPVYFVDSKEYFGKDKVYFGNNSERFLFFSLACLHILTKIDFLPNVIHCHDFHSAMITDILKASGLYSSYLAGVATVYTVHNLNYQGKSEIEVLSTANLRQDTLKVLSKDAQDGDINFMAQGILNADIVNTVSPSYAKEIGTSMYGAGLEKVVQENRHKFFGVLNGIDTDFFNPAKDKFIHKNYSLRSIGAKKDNKVYLQKKLGLPEDRHIPIVGLVSRLAWQKGLELFEEKGIKEIIKSDKPCQFVFLGTGDKVYEKELKRLGKKYDQNISSQITFSVDLAQEIYAASDIFIMPSRFEPCGLGQMIAMRYGTVPVVRATGGLKDTVNAKTGFKFREFESSAMFDCLKKALKVYYDNPDKWGDLKRNCMRQDFSWTNSAKKYLALYEKAIKKKRK